MQQPYHNRNFRGIEFRVDLVYILPSYQYSINNFTVQYIYNYTNKFLTTDQDKISTLPYVTTTLHHISGHFHYETQSFDKDGNLYTVNPDYLPHCSGLTPQNINPFDFKNFAEFLLQNLWYGTSQVRRPIKELTYIETSYV